MKTKLMLAMAVAVFAGSFGVAKAQAEEPGCVRACLQQYRLCVRYSPVELCNAWKVECFTACGVYN